MTVPGGTVGPYSFRSAPIAVSQGMGPFPEYAVPTYGTDGPGYHDSPVAAYSSPLREFPGGFPDPSRLSDIPRRDYRPDPRVPPEYFWNGSHGVGTERLARHGVEYQDADGFAVPLPTARPQAPNPRFSPPAEPRPTNRMSPHTYTFTRPWQQDMARTFNGLHFSMADHRRAYPILGMVPFTRKRNTYRADPTPWDIDNVDAPAPQPSETPGRIVPFDIPPSGGQSWRLQ